MPFLIQPDIALQAVMSRNELNEHDYLEVLDPTVGSVSTIMTDGGDTIEYYLPPYRRKVDRRIRHYWEFPYDIKDRQELV